MRLTGNAQCGRGEEKKKREENQKLEEGREKIERAGSQGQHVRRCPKKTNVARIHDALIRVNRWPPADVKADGVRQNGGEEESKSD